MKTNIFLLLFFLLHFQPEIIEIILRQISPSHSFVDQNQADSPESSANFAHNIHDIADNDFDSLNRSLLWKKEFEDKGTGNWKKRWTLDGLEARVENDEKGMHFSAGPEFKNDAHHAVLWTKASFKGDLKIEFDYTRTDTETRCVNILYLQASGKGDKPYVKDISKWKEFRKVPAMRVYYENMDALHISFAAFNNTSDTSFYIRARRYPKPENGTFDATKIPPSYDNQGYFKTGETYHITVIKTNTRLFFAMEGKDTSRRFSWDLSDVDPVTDGRIGLRHMYTRTAIYRNLKIYSK